jgi:predicted HAD superfamily hydrolase
MKEFYIMSFHKDRYLKTLGNDIEKYDVICFDVFDTLLFRACDSPDVVFFETGKQLASLPAFPYAPETYQALRIEAQNRACQIKQISDNTRECKFYEIFDELPFSPELRSKMMWSEMEQEGFVIYLNPNAVALIMHARKIRKKLVLISEMYYSKEEIQALIQGAGLDTNIFCDCFVSSDYGANKISGDLFAKVLERFPNIEPSRILHIGDHYAKDIEGAKKTGMQAIHYTAIPREFGNMYDIERLFYESDLGELTSLRKLAGISHAYKHGCDAAVFHEIGAEVIGPVYALFAEWVVNSALRDNVKVLLPLMREGELLSRVICNVISRRKADIACIPFFASRLPVFTASITERNFTAKIEQTLLKIDSSLAHIFSDLGIDISKSPFFAQGEQTLRHLKQSDVFIDLMQYLFRDETRSLILQYASNQRKLLLYYIQNKTAGKKAATVDLGIRGTTESLLRGIIKESTVKIDLMHYVMMGSGAHNVHNIMDGLRIFAWLGIAGENDGKITRILFHIPIIEALVNAPCGTLLAYQIDQNEVVPLTDTLELQYIHNNFPKAAACWNGVMTFQKMWFLLLEKKPTLLRLLTRKTSFLNIFLRYIEMPTTREAQYAGQLVYYDRYVRKEAVALCDFLLPDNLSDAEIREVLASYKNRHSLWPQAAIAISFPTFFPREFLLSCKDMPFIREMAFIIQEIIAQTFKNVVIYAAGQRGHDFCKIAELFDIPIRCFVDGNRNLQGNYIMGKKIVALHELGEDVDAFVVTALRYGEEIANDIRKHYEKNEKEPQIFQF